MPRTLVNTVGGSVLGEVKAFSGSTVPAGYMLCHGQAISRTEYAGLFALIGAAHGQGDGTTTFNLPDYRGQFLRGRVNISTVTGSGTAASNQATFTNHGINRTGFRIRLSSGTLSGLAASIDYFAIVVDSNTLAFATTQANALANTRVAISGANSAVIMQWEDPDASSRIASNAGGNTGNAVGSVQEDQVISHNHEILPFAAGANPAAGNFLQGATSDSSYGSLNTNVRGGNETRPKNVTVNYIIKVI